MPADYSNTQSQPQIRKGLAIASLVLGIINIPTLGLLGVGAITAITLGAIAIGKVNREPAIYGGKRLAIAGIITSVASLLLIPVFGVLASMAIPLMMGKAHGARESAAIQRLRTIHNSQAVFQAAERKFGSLKDLNEAGLIDANYLDSAVGGYIYTFGPEVNQDKYCVQATRQAPSVASRDYNIDQDGIIRYSESKAPSPVPCGKGVPLTEPGAGSDGR